jgi:DNA polymerase III epsilon subunit-like protein
MTIVWFDFETGGLTPDKPNIQLAAIAIDTEWKELETFERKLKFDEATADPEALKMNHYDPAVWENEAIPEGIAVADFGAFLKRHRSVDMLSKRTGKPYSVARLAGHNAASFDGPRLQAMFKRHDAFLPAHPQVLCTLQRALWYAIETGTKFESLKLEALCKHFGIEIPDAHDALVDVRASISLAHVMRVGAVVNW